MNGYWAKNLQEVYPLYQTKEQRLENQLALCGTKPEEIKKVIISHMHLDHAGNLNMFKHADVYVSKADFMQAQTQVRLNENPLTHGGYIKADMEVLVKQYHLVEEDFEFAKGVEIINLPGHTPGLLYDSLSFFKSIEKVRALEKKYDTKVFFAYDEEFFKTIKLAPEFYK